MDEIQKTGQEPEEEKSQARLDYEAGQEFMEKGDKGQAANAFHNALIGFEQEKDDNGVANASDKLADICSARGDHQTALKHIDRAYAIVAKHSDRFSLFSLEKKKAAVMHAAGDYDQAINLYLDVLDEYSALNNPQGSVNTLEILAELYVENGDRSKAADAYRVAASIHKNFKHKKHAEEFLKKAAELEKS